MKAKKQETAATMKDVALKAKVSTATVSRALMNPDKVSRPPVIGLKKRPGSGLFTAAYGAQRQA